MKHSISTYILLLLSVGLTSCVEGILDHVGVAECDYTVQIRYDYNAENTSSTNLLTTYIGSLDEFLFDEDGILYAVRPLAVDECTGQWVSEYDLPPGRYSVIAIGNRSDMSVINDARIGHTRREDMLMTLTTANPSNDTDRLYHGYRTFTVVPNGVSNVRVDMVHSHCIIRFRIRWKNNTPPMGNYYSVMKYIPSEYSLMPEYYYPKPFEACTKHIPESSDPYSQAPQSVRHHITTVHANRDLLDHTIALKRNVDGEVIGQFVMYRIKNENHPTMSLHTGTTRASEQVMKDIDLQRYFLDQGIDHDSSLKQEYNIEIMIDGDRVSVMSVTIGDWQEGGPLG